MINFYKTLIIFKFLCSNTSVSGFSLSTIVSEIPVSCLVSTLFYENDLSQEILANTRQTWIFFKHSQHRPNFTLRESRQNFMKQGDTIKKRLKTTTCVINFLYLPQHKTDVIKMLYGTWLHCWISTGGEVKNHNKDFAIILSDAQSVDAFGSVSGGVLTDFKNSGRHHIILQCALILGLHDLGPFKVYVMPGPERSKTFERVEEVVYSLKLNLFRNHNPVPNAIRVSLTDKALYENIMPYYTVYESNSTEMQFFRLLLLTSNATYEPRENLFFYPTIRSGAFIHFDPRRNNHVVSLTTNTLYAFTCYCEAKLSFQMYYSPFDSYVWMCILFVGGTLCCLIWLYVHFCHQNIKNYSVLLLYISSLTEEPFYVPVLLQRITWIKVLLAMWVFESVVITCLFTSKLISQLNKPLKGTKVESIFDLFCDHPLNYTITNLQDYMDNNIYSLLFDEKPSEMLHHEAANIISYDESLFEINETFFRRFVNSTCYALLSQPIETQNLANLTSKVSNPYFYYIYDLFVKYAMSLYFKSDLKKAISKRLLYLNRQTRHNPIVPKGKQHWGKEFLAETATEHELVQCGKSVFFAHSNDGEYEYYKSNYESREFYKLKEPFDTYTLRWSLEYFGDFQFLNNLKKFIERGIYDKLYRKSRATYFLKRYKNTRILQKENKVERVSSLSLKTSVQTVFILYGVFMGSAIICYLGEIACPNEFNSCILCFYKISTVILSLRKTLLFLKFMFAHLRPALLFYNKK